MAVAIEYISVIIPISNIEKYYYGGFEQYKKDVRHLKRIWFDDFIVHDGAMNPFDIEEIIKKWEKYGLKTIIENNGELYWNDLCVVDMMTGKTLLCEWLIEKEKYYVSHIDEVLKNSERKVSPDNISILAENEIFVFGSNIYGNHDGGAARVAKRKWGAVQGIGEGLQGQTYAIPTMFKTVEKIQPYVEHFINFAEENPQMHFLVTKIGCGIAGFKVNEIADIFVDVIDKNIKNILLPKEFLKAGHII